MRGVGPSVSSGVRVAGLVVVLVAAACGGPVETTTTETTTTETTTTETTTTETTTTETTTVETRPIGTSDPVDEVAAVVPEGFGITAARVVVPTGDGGGGDGAGTGEDVCEVCLWVADDDTTRPRGLMFVTDLGGADGMAFVYDRPTATAFTMRNTVLPLTIVFYGPDGRYLEAFDMEPCVAEPCPSYPTPQGFTVAVEVLQGTAADLLMVPGSRLELVEGDCHTPVAD